MGQRWLVENRIGRKNLAIDECDSKESVYVFGSKILFCKSKGSAPSISVDNVGGCQLYLSKDSLGASITTAKSSEINVPVPSEGSEGDWGEHALPQQFVTPPASHSGG